MSYAPEYVAFVSWGNDSIALLQYLHDQGHEDVVAVHSDTGWAAPWWKERLKEGRLLCREYGFGFVVLPSIGMKDLVRKRKGWPRNGMQFCTAELKIKPAMAWLDRMDPERESVCCVGVRREESARRSSWPEWTEDSAMHGGRSLWAPLVRVRSAERDALVERAWFDVLPTRSVECYPCVNASKADLRLLDEERVKEIEALEHELGYTSNGRPRTMFRSMKTGGAVGIREVVRWAHSDRGKFEPLAPCDAGWCGS